jgi:hypothetical protein
MATDKQLPAGDWSRRTDPVASVTLSSFNRQPSAGIRRITRLSAKMCHGSGAISIIALGAIAVASNMAQAQDAFPPPGHTRAVAAPYTAVPPILDGHLDDESWQQAAQGRDFWISLEKRPPKDETVVLVLRDNFNLYFAIQCYDSDPESIVAIRSRRDAGLGSDDRVGIELDSFHNYRTISTYWVNAIGTQNDEITGGRARKIEWKGDWKASVTRTEYGWSAEFAIPFKILNYHSEATRFGINFLRYQNRTDELSNWADVTPQHKREEMGQLLGLVLPERAKTQPWTLMPYALGGLNISDIDGDEHDALAYAGATIRYEPRPNITSVLSLYPDFNQLETQITDIDFSYTEKFRPDPRPFFQEGSAYFDSDIGYFYSNRVPDIWGGAKSFAQYGNNAIGGLFTRAPDNRWDGVVRYVREIDARHSAEAMLVATHQEDLENQLAVIQIDGREESGLYYEADLAYSNTEKREFDDGGAFVGALGWPPTAT